MPRISWFDIPADDPERAQKFYKEVFDWSFDKWDGPMLRVRDAGRLHTMPSINRHAAQFAQRCTACSGPAASVRCGRGKLGKEELWPRSNRRSTQTRWWQHERSLRKAQRRETNASQPVD